MSTALLLWGVVFSAIGLGYLVYGKQQKAPIPLITGFALVVYPYFVGNTWLLVAIGVALSAVPWLIRI